VDENDAVGLALLVIRRGHEESDIESGNAQYRGCPAEPRNHFSRERIEGLGRGVPEYVDASCQQHRLVQSVRSRAYIKNMFEINKL
jgi:hypothetical protein